MIQRISFSSIVSVIVLFCITLPFIVSGNQKASQSQPELQSYGPEINQIKGSFSILIMERHGNSLDYLQQNIFSIRNHDRGIWIETHRKHEWLLLIGVAVGAGAALSSPIVKERIRRIADYILREIRKHSDKAEVIQPNIGIGESYDYRQAQIDLTEIMENSVQTGNTIAIDLQPN
jgi:hypothetical protein